MAAAAVIAELLATLNAQETYSPSGTYQFAVKDGNQLLLDEYPASPGSVTAIDGNAKPSIVFVCGGGFKGGERSHKEYLPWFRMLNDEGYTVLTIDYRLALGSQDQGRHWLRQAVLPFCQHRQRGSVQRHQIHHRQCRDAEGGSPQPGQSALPRVRPPSFNRVAAVQRKGHQALPKGNRATRE